MSHLVLGWEKKKHAIIEHTRETNSYCGNFLSIDRNTFFHTPHSLNSNTMCLQLNPTVMKKI